MNFIFIVANTASLSSVIGITLWRDVENTRHPAALGRGAHIHGWLGSL